jgi:hypothetical protein
MPAQSANRGFCGEGGADGKSVVEAERMCVGVLWKPYVGPKTKRYCAFTTPAKETNASNKENKSIMAQKKVITLQERAKERKTKSRIYAPKPGRRECKSS